MGVGFADPSVIAAIDRVRPPFNVSNLGQVGAEASVQDPGHLRRAVQLVKEGRRQILPVLSALGLPVVPSVGNFFLLDMAPMRGKAVFESLLKRGIIVRSMDEYGYPHHIRVTYGLPAENKAFLHALREVVAR